MSAYIVDRETIQYLVQSGLEAAFQHHQGHKMRWYHDGESHWLDDRNASDVGQMLWDENIASVAYRYSDSRHEGLPGPANESGYVYFHEDTTVGYIWKPAQILKATDCYEYQSCEHPGWWSSSAKAFIDVLRKLAWTRVAGYEDAQWGHPVAKETSQWSRIL